MNHPILINKPVKFTPGHVEVYVTIDTSDIPANEKIYVFYNTYAIFNCEVINKVLQGIDFDMTAFALATDASRTELSYYDLQLNKLEVSYDDSTLLPQGVE